MLSADMTILYVDNPILSARFYSDLFDRPPEELAPTFALFVLDNGFRLGLWSRFTATPAPAPDCRPATSELLLTVESRQAVDALYKDWGFNRGITMIQAPTTLEFGYTFTALDPDGHRIRLCCYETA